MALLITVLAWGSVLARPAIAAEADGPSALPTDFPYTYRDRASSDGIGKVYLGREIAKVMGYEGQGKRILILLQRENQGFSD